EREQSSQIQIGPIHAISPFAVGAGATASILNQKDRESFAGRSEAISPNCGLSAAKAEVPYFVAQAPGLRFVTSLGPAGRAVLPAVRPFDEPFEPVAMPAYHHQRVAQINGMIGPEAELPAG